MHRDERGIAIVLALFLMSTMSVLAASMMFLAQTETYATMNYRMMSQARYAGEAGVQKAADFLLDPAQYAVPTTSSVVDPLGNFDRDQSPVLYMGKPVILSTDPDAMPSNYPSAAVQTAFFAAAKGSLAAGNATVTYGAYAKLIAMQEFTAYGGTQNVVQTWEITGIGKLAGPRKGIVEVVAVVETPKVAANNFAAFATGDICGALYFPGNVSIDSYDSRIPGGPDASQQNSGGDVGTNGNLNIVGSVEIFGNLYTPRVGVGTCSEGSVNALTETGNASVNGSVVQLPTAMTYPVPALPPNLPRDVVAVNSTASLTGACDLLGMLDPSVRPGVNCNIDTGTKTITIEANGIDVNLPSLVIDNGYTLSIVGHNPAQTVNINSLSGDGGFTVAANSLADLNESVVLKVAGVEADDITGMATPIDMSLMAWKQNASDGRSYNSSALQIVYGGSGTIRMDGGGNLQSAMSIYAPNAALELQGTQDFYGSILARTIESYGNAGIHYDRRLGGEFYVVGHAMLGSFTLKRY
jgi:hypothetical protein